MLHNSLLNSTTIVNELESLNAVTTTITGQGVATDLNNATITIAPGASAAGIGSGNDIAEGSRTATTSVDGNNNTLTLGSADIATVVGTGGMVRTTRDTVYRGGKSSATVTDAGNVVNTAPNNSVTASNDTINGGLDASGTSLSDVTNIQGSENSVTGSAGATLNVVVDTDNLVLIANETLTLSGTEEAGGDTGTIVTAIGSDTLTLDYLSGEGCFPNIIVTSTNTDNILNLTSKDAFATVTGDAQAAATGNNNSFQLAGNYETVSLGAEPSARATGNYKDLILATTTYADLQGLVETVAASDGYITLANDSTATVNGSNHVLAIARDDAKATVTVGSDLWMNVWCQKIFAGARDISNEADSRPGPFTGEKVLACLGYVRWGLRAARSRRFLMQVREDMIESD